MGIDDGCQRDDGTASMEMLLVLPLLVLILVLLVDMGYGWYVRARADTAARFVGTTFIRAEPYDLGWSTANRAVRAYYGDLENLEFQVEEQARIDVFDDGAWIGLDWRRWVDTLGTWIGGLSSQQTVTLVVERRPPIGSLLTDQPLSATFGLDGESWTYDEIPLSIPGMVDALTDFGDVGQWGDSVILAVFRSLAFIIGYAARGFFWLLGMYP